MNGITAYQCKQCGQVMYPHHLRCLQCNGRDFETIAPHGVATLVTYTIMEQLPWGFDERGRILGIVRFENKVQAMGIVLVDEPRLGMSLRAAWQPVRTRTGEAVYGLTFKALE